MPTFQCPYVWNQEEQWEPPWDDVRNAAERYLDELAALGSDATEHGAKAERRRPPRTGRRACTAWRRRCSRCSSSW